MAICIPCKASSVCFQSVSEVTRSGVHSQDPCPTSFPSQSLEGPASPTVRKVLPHTAETPQPEALKKTWDMTARFQLLVHTEIYASVSTVN